jgi:hypothetical protein
MSDTQQPQPAGTGAARDQAAAELAEIQRRHEQVINAALVPVWYWWAMAAAIIAIGAARDSANPVVQAIVIPLAALVIAGLIVATIPGVRRRVQVNRATQPADARAAAAIFSLIVLVIAVTGGIAASLAAAHVPYPITIGSAAGAAVLVIAGPLVNRYLRRLMLRQARQQTSGAPQAGGSTP